MNQQAARSEPRKQSKTGIASFIIAIISIVGLIAAYYGTISAADELAPQVEDTLPEGFGSLLLMIGLMCLFVITALAGAVLGIVGMFQRHRRKAFAVIGLAGNALLVLVVLIVLVVGMITAPALPGTM